MIKDSQGRGAWVAQAVKHLTVAQVMISRSVSLSPALGSVLTVQSLGPASDSVPPSLLASSPLVLSLSLSKMNVLKKIKKKDWQQGGVLRRKNKGADGMS